MDQDKDRILQALLDRLINSSEDTEVGELEKYGAELAKAEDEEDAVDDCEDGDEDEDSKRVRKFLSSFKD